MLKYSDISILIVDIGAKPEGWATPWKRYIAQCSEYPVRNGSGDTVDEAVDDLIIAIHVHLHNRKYQPHREGGMV